MTTKTLSTWLQRINQPLEWLNPKLSNISDQTLILDRDVVISRLAKAIQLGEHVVFFGDYDVDGITSAVILTDAVRRMGGRCSISLASRFSGGGYGFSDIACTQVLALRPKVVVTLDCGSSDHDRIQRLKDNGVDILVIDHHLVPDRPLPADAFINPHRPECKSTFKWFASGGLAWSVVGGLSRLLGSDVKASDYLDLAALATIADVAPLVGNNRDLVRAGLKAISEAKRPGLRALMQLGKLEIGKPITGRDVGFRIAPQINAPGRLTNPDIIANLLLSNDPSEIEILIKEVEQLTDTRRLVTEEITTACVKEVEANYLGKSAIVIGHPDWSHGIVGICAARLVDKYNVPVCVIGHEGRGSLRGPPGVQLYSALQHSAEHLLKYGGHAAAAGCQIQFVNLNNFRQAFCNYFEQNPVVPPDTLVDPVIELDLQDNLLKLVDEWATLEPCGQGNPRPKIKIEGKVKFAKVVKGGHLKIDVILPDSRTIGCFFIGAGDREKELIGQNVSIIGDLRKNEWNGRVSAEIFVEYITT